MAFQTANVSQRQRAGEIAGGVKRRPKFRSATIEHVEFNKQGSKTMSIVVQYIGPRIIHRIKHCITTRQITEVLNSLYRSESEVSHDAVERELFLLYFNENGGKMEKYTEKFEKLAEKYRDMGGIFDNKQEIERFRMSLQASYESVRDWY